MKAPHAGLFADIAWSTPRVADQTRQRARTLGLDLVELPSWYDVDDRATLLRLLDAVDTPSPGAVPAYAAPATAGCARQLDLRRLLASTDAHAVSAVR